MTGNIYTVKQLNEYVYHLFANEPFFGRICVQGEVSNLSAPRSGHLYFSLKDESGKVPVAMFRSAQKGLKADIKDGDKVIVTGEVTVYTRGGYYQIIATKIAPAGVGDLHVRFEQLKKALEEEGLFDAAHKKPIPKYAVNIGIVTAKTGAVIRDIIRITKRRNPHIRLLLYPTLVQGENAPEQIAEGIEVMDSLGMDVIIVGRGGGSIEDLWAFNEEIVARAIYDSETPIVSAVGHETDTTIADFVADRRAATPSEAAEICAFDYGRFLSELSGYERNFAGRMERKLTENIRTASMLEDKLSYLHPTRQLEQKKERMDTIALRMRQAILFQQRKANQRIALLAEQLDGRSPVKKFASGFAYPVNEKGKNIKSIKDVSTGDIMTVFVADGQIRSSVL